MLRVVLVLIALVVLLSIGGWLFFMSPSTSPGVLPDEVVQDTRAAPVVLTGTPGPLHRTTYRIKGESFTFANGVAKSDAPSGTSVQNISVFAPPAYGDVDGNGSQDAVVLLVDSQERNGTFYYVAVALLGPGGYTGSEAYFLGDRVLPQNFSIAGGLVLVSYLDREPGDSISAPPTIRKTVRIRLDTQAMQLIDPVVTSQDVPVNTTPTTNPDTTPVVVDDTPAPIDTGTSTGDAVPPPPPPPPPPGPGGSTSGGSTDGTTSGMVTPSQQELSLQRWVWIESATNAGTVTKPNATGAYALIFSAEGSFAGTTDCNTLSGTYTANQSAITFTQISKTEIACATTQEDLFVSMLNSFEDFFFTQSGELVFRVKQNGGIVVFR